MSTPITETKGTDLIALKEYVLDRAGHDGYERWVAALSDAAREGYATGSRFKILPSQWYPTEEMLLIPLEQACAQLHGGDLAAGCRDFGRFSADYGFQGVYRLVLKVGPAKAMISQIPRVMSLYLRPASAETVDVGSHHVTIRFHGIPPRESYDLQNLGFIERVVELVGMTPGDIELTHCTGRGDAYSEIVVRWAE